MEWLIVVVILAVVWWLIQSLKARRITKARATQLSEKTGHPAERIHRQMRQERLTPGEWAAREGLDPFTFEPTQDRREAEEWWSRNRLNPNQPMPSVEEASRIMRLHHRIAILEVDPNMTLPPIKETADGLPMHQQESFVDLAKKMEEQETLAAEGRQLENLLAELYRAGTRVDASTVKAFMKAMDKSPAGRSISYRTQVEYDELQGRIIQREKD